MNLRIESSTTPYWNPLQTAEFVPIAQTLPFENDSLETTKESICAWNGLFPEYSSIVQIDFRPKLEAPIFDTRKLPTLSAEIANHLIPKVTDKEGVDPTKADTNTAEIILFILYIASIKAHRSNLEESSLVTFNLVKKSQQANQQIMKEYFDKKDEKITRSKVEEALSWIGWTFFGALAITGIASLALTIATAGAALPALVVLAKALLGIGSAGVSASQGILKYQDNQTEAELIGLETERYINMDKIKQGIEQLKADAEMIGNATKEQGEVLENLYNASLNR